ncbi:hypothetical protein KCP78_05885 [Salmonella enterica subsp. enterica]|nr:hypothetical protein KCP78_05885 [Salmonella enterica subsp. enterica]
MVITLGSGTAELLACRGVAAALKSRSDPLSGCGIFVYPLLRARCNGDERRGVQQRRLPSRWELHSA